MIGAPAYIECSSKTQLNVKGVFDAAIKVVLQPPKQKKKKGRAQRACSIFSYECRSKHGAIPFVTKYVSSVFGYSVLSNGILVSVDGCADRKNTKDSLLNW
ncbi:unnamed protein product [Fraxinus pennsylvanica]|uniref:Uncharacterized protein n=1 Tax=Fraxinus pennsylvanica TaxID=56036 RepID=A0AAD1ZYD0_9LAMI|nr:unnamed protein product [Fraxinus pennsylvanica]